MRANTSAMPAPIVPSPTTPMEENTRELVMNPMLTRPGSDRRDLVHPRVAGGSGLPGATG